MKIPGALCRLIFPQPNTQHRSSPATAGWPLYKSDGFMSPSYWPIGLWNTPDSPASVDPSPRPHHQPRQPLHQQAKLQGAGAPSTNSMMAAQQHPANCRHQTQLRQHLHSRPARLESQSVPAHAILIYVSQPCSRTINAHLARSPFPNQLYGGPSLITGTNADTAPAVAGPAGVPPPPSAKSRPQNPALQAAMLPQ